MFSQHAQNSPDEALFETFCQLVTEKNAKALAEMIGEGMLLTAIPDTNPLILLAKKGDSESVEFLINKFDASHNYATWGYAWGKHVDRVNEQIVQGTSRNYAVWGYARGGYTDLVNEQIAQGVSRDYAVLGYAQGGYTDLVNEQIAQGASRNNAVQGYAQGGYIDQVNKQIAQGANRGWAM